MNLIMAAGLFDSPWMVIIIVLGGALINWLTKYRADKAARNQPPTADSAAPQPPAAPNWEESLRRLFEDKSQEQPVQPAPVANPPPLIRRAPNQGRASIPPVIKPAERPFFSPPPAPLVEIVPVSELGEVAVRRYELSSAAHAAQARHASQRLLQAQSKKARPILVSLRHPHVAKQAFAVSLVFGPPKGLEL